MKSVYFKNAQGLRDALRVRKIRNTCRDFMTNSNESIGIVQQLRWWRNRDKEYVVYLIQLGRKPIGYGLVRKKGPYVSGGLLPEYRGYGYGRKLFKFLTWQAYEIGRRNRVYLEVFDSNTAAKKVYEGLGYRRISKRDEKGNTILVMKWTVNGSNKNNS